MADNDELVKLIKQHIKARDWEQFHDSKNIALSLVLEATEILELYQWTKDNQIQPGKEGELADELADVYYWLLYLADIHNIDLNAAFKKKMAKNKKKYPVDKAKGTAKKYTEL